MTTYRIVSNYGSDKRITLPGVSTFQFYSSRDNGATVTFYTQEEVATKDDDEFGPYNKSTVVAAFSGVEAVYAEGTQLEALEWEHPQVEAQPAAQMERTWKAVA